MLSVDQNKGFMYQVGDNEYLLVLVLSDIAGTVSHKQCF